MSAHKPMPQKQMVAVTAVNLRRLGFYPAYTSKSGSRYMRLAEFPWHIRLSDHQWGGFSRARNPHVIKNVVVQPAPHAEAWPFAVEIAIRFMATCRHRQITAGAARRTV